MRMLRSVSCVLRNSQLKFCLRAFVRCVLLVGGLQTFLVIALGDTLIVPGGAVSGFGDTYSDPLFDTEPNVVQIYGSQEFAAAGSGPLLISGIAFRLDPAEAGSMNVILPTLFIRASTYSGSLGAASFSEINRLPYTVVFDSSNIPLQAKPTNPNNFSVQLPFQTPFLYDPAKGALALNFYGGLGGGFIQSVDAQHSGDSLILRHLPDGHTALDPILTVTKFTYTTVPEPNSLVILALGCGLVLPICATLKRVI